MKKYSIILALALMGSVTQAAVVYENDGSSMDGMNTTWHQVDGAGTTNPVWQSDGSQFIGQNITNYLGGPAVGRGFLSATNAINVEVGEALTVTFDWKGVSPDIPGGGDPTVDDYNFELVMRGTDSVTVGGVGAASGSILIRSGGHPTNAAAFRCFARYADAWESVDSHIQIPAADTVNYVSDTWRITWTIQKTDVEWSSTEMTMTNLTSGGPELSVTSPNANGTANLTGPVYLVFGTNPQIGYGATNYVDNIKVEVGIPPVPPLYSYNWGNAIGTMWAADGWTGVNWAGHWYRTNSPWGGSMAQHRPGVSTNHVDVSTAGMKQTNVTFNIAAMSTGNVLRVSFDSQLFVDGVADNTFFDMHFSPNDNVALGGVNPQPLDAGINPSDQLGFRLKQAADTGGGSYPDGTMRCAFEPTMAWENVWLSTLPELGLYPTTSDNESGDLTVVYTAEKSATPDLFICSLTVTNKDDEFSYSSGDYIITNAVAYSSSEMYLTVFGAGDWTAGTGGYHMDNLKVEILGDAGIQGYDLWVLGYPSADLSDPYADYDADGIDNVSEYGFNGDPEVDVSIDTGIVIPVATFTNVVDGWCDYYHIERTEPGTDDITYRFEHRSDLIQGAWGVGEIVPESYPHALPGFDLRRRRAWLGTSAAADDWYFRIRVTKP